MTTNAETLKKEKPAPKTGGRKETLSAVKEKPKKKRLTKTQKLQREAEELKEQALRAAAEFANSNRRREREVERVIQAANTALIEAMLPVLDDVERSLASFREGSNENSIGEGLELIRDKFLGVLAKQGVESIAAEGEKFDPEKHEALTTRKSDSHESSMVLEEYLKGYTLHGVVLRPSKVVVSE